MAVPATTLSIYNDALGFMNERALAATSEDRESRRVLDGFYATVVQFCLEQGMWDFAMRTSTLTSAGSGSAGYSTAFNKPTDFVRLFKASINTNFDPPLVYGFAAFATQFHANNTTLNIMYVSNDVTNGGGLLSRWPQAYGTYVAMELAARTAFRITGDPNLANYLKGQSADFYENALRLHSQVGSPGMLPFNAEARGAVAGEAVNRMPVVPGIGSIARRPSASEQDRARGN